jgi:class 3 adenylate cyclase
MKCPRCQAENDAGARFCEDCGARLEAACPSCGTPVTPGKKFCRSCGAALGRRPGPREPGSVMAILQCDVEGSTALARELGDRRWADLLAGYGRVADLAVAAHGGRIVDRTGDGLMATFPGPVAAIRAAKRLQQEATDVGIRVRAGIHVGDVLQENGALRGIAVHVAARVMAGAKGGEIFVTETAKDIVAGARLRFEDRGVHALKGIEGPRRLFAVV